MSEIENFRIFFVTGRVMYVTAGISKRKIYIKNICAKNECKKSYVSVVVTGVKGFQ